MMGLCNPTQTRSRCCRRRPRTKPAPAGARRPNQTTRSACAGTGHRTGTSDSRGGLTHSLGFRGFRGPGGALFLASDCLLALEKFGGLRLPAHEGLVMATYASAQALLACPVVRRE